MAKIINVTFVCNIIKIIKIIAAVFFLFYFSLFDFWYSSMKRRMKFSSL